MRYLNVLTGNVLYIFILIMWIAGVVLAKGFLALIAIFIPFYAWYLVVEKVMIANGWAQINMNKTNKEKLWELYLATLSGYSAQDRSDGSLNIAKHAFEGAKNAFTIWNEKYTFIKNSETKQKEKPKVQFSPWQERAITERVEIIDRLDMLRDYMTSSAYRELDLGEQTRLITQFKALDAYLITLEERIKYF